MEKASSSAIRTYKDGVDGVDMTKVNRSFFEGGRGSALPYFEILSCGTWERTIERMQLNLLLPTDDTSDPVLSIQPMQDRMEHSFHQCEAEGDNGEESQTTSGPDQRHEEDAVSITSDEDEDLLFQVLIDITTEAPETCVMNPSSPQYSQDLEDLEGIPSTSTTKTTTRSSETHCTVYCNENEIRKVGNSEANKNLQRNSRSANDVANSSSTNCNKKGSRKEVPEEYHDDNEGKPNDEATEDEETSLTSDQSSRLSSSESDHWFERFHELKEFKEKTGHCLVPCNYKENPALARWVKRQRNQYKQLSADGFADDWDHHVSGGGGEQGGNSSSKLVKDRIHALQSIHFVWDRHEMAWHQKLVELKEFQAEFGDCNVPANYSANPQLAMWIKCQRRQYKKFKNGSKTGMTAKRVELLESLGISWELRNGYKKHKKDV